MGAQIARGNGRSRRQRALAEINVTPLVDVMLVLLIISMLAAPMLQRGIPLQLPAIETGEEIDEARVIVSVDRNVTIRINDRPVHYNLFEERMEGVALQRPGDTVYLRADKLLPYEEVLLVMDKIRKAGIENVALVTVPAQILHEDDK